MRYDGIRNARFWIVIRKDAYSADDCLGIFPTKAAAELFAGFGTLAAEFDILPCFCRTIEIAYEGGPEALERIFGTVAQAKGWK